MYNNYHTSITGKIPRNHSLSLVTFFNSLRIIIQNYWYLNRVFELRMEIGYQKLRLHVHLLCSWDLTTITNMEHFTILQVQRQIPEIVLNQ